MIGENGGNGVDFIPLDDADTFIGTMHMPLRSHALSPLNRIDVLRAQLVVAA